MGGHLGGRWLYPSPILKIYCIPSEVQKAFGKALGGNLIGHVEWTAEWGR